MPKKQGHNARRRANARLRDRSTARMVQTYPVYAREDIHGQTPLYFISKEIRDQWLADGAVTPMSRGKSVRLLLNLPPKPQPSASMGQSIMEGCWDNKPYALACAAAWRATARFAA